MSPLPVVLPVCEAVSGQIIFVSAVEHLFGFRRCLSVFFNFFFFLISHVSMWKLEMELRLNV